MCGLDVQERADKEKGKEFPSPPTSTGSQILSSPQTTQAWKPGEMHFCFKWCPDRKHLTLNDPILRLSVLKLPSYIRGDHRFHK